MGGLRELPGFLGTGGNFLVDLTLIVEILFYISLCLGVTAQLRKKYKWHDRFQIPVVVLNIFLIALIMIPTFLAISGEGIGRIPPLVLAHAGLGLLAQGVAIYCLLAGLKILPRKIGVLRYFMWAAFALWTLTVLLGIGLYISFYTGGSATSGPAEHSPDLAAEHAAAPVAEAPATQAPVEQVQEHVAEHAPELIEEAPTTAPTEAIAEHAQEPAELPQETAEATAELVAEHAQAEPELAAEHAAEVAAEPTATPIPPTPTPIPVPTRVGLLTTSDEKVHGDKATLAMSGVTPPADGSVYEAWLTGEGRPPLSLGKLTLTGDVVNHTFVDPDGRVLLGVYSGMFISVESANDGDPAPSGVVAYQGEVPSAVVALVRLILAATPTTPNKDALGINLLNQIFSKMEPEVNFQQDYSIANNDLAALKIQAEGIVNIIEGNNGPNFGDLDGNGETYNTGDGFGLLGEAGYLPAVNNAAAAAAQAEGASDEVKLRAEQTQTAIQTSTALLEQIRDLELQLIQAQDVKSATEPVNQVIALFNQLKDADGAGLTDPTKGSIRAVYNYSQLIGGIEVFALANQAAAPATAPTPELIDEHAADAEHAGN
jgi:hypothetical protein